MTLTYAILRDTRLHRPKRPKKPVEKKIKNETKFPVCPRTGEKCHCAGRKKK